MGDNDFTAGDPWGLPIEDSEETEIRAARPEDEAPLPEDEAGFVIDEEPEPEEESGPEPGPEDEADLAEDVDQDERWSSTAEDIGHRAVDDDSTLEDADEAAEETSEGEDDEYIFKAPSRTPLSQMIAAAQSVVSSVQGDRSEDGEDVDESSTPDEEPHFAEAAHTGEQPAAEGIEAEPLDVPSYVAPVHAAGDDDLPEEPPSWMIIDSPTEGEPSDAPLDIEASIADLATPETPEVPFAEDRFEMPGEQEPEREDDFGVVDLDSAPGVYSELHDLDGQDEQAETLLQEAAKAFGRTDPITVEPIEEAIPAPEDIDSYAEALAAQLGADQPTSEPIEEATQDLEEPIPAPEDIDSYAEALAAQLGADQPTS
ncbi:MAG: hypothetical protein ACXW15_12235, partial [Acidimicrobiia bacterium]